MIALRTFLNSFLISFSMTISIAAYAQSVESISNEESFFLPTSDKKTEIRGVISLPKSNHGQKLVPIVFVGGTGSSRDGVPYASPSDPLRLDKYWYRILAEALTKTGFSVVRYDNRGLGSGLDCDKASGAFADPWTYAAGPYHCYDRDAAITTTFQSKREDLLSVFKMIAHDKRFDAKKTIVVAHSEGAIHIASLISQKAVSPTGVLFIGGPADSSAAVYDWQHVDRQVEWMRKIIVNNNNYISNKDILEYYKNEVKGYDKPVLADGDGWALSDLPTIKARYTAIEENDKSEILSKSENGFVFGNIEDLIKNIPMGSTSYFQSLAIDENKVIDGLQGYKGRMTFVFGKNDIVIPWQKQIDLIRGSTWGHSTPKTIEIGDMDHNMAKPDGTISKQGIDIVVNEIESMARH